MSYNECFDKGLLRKSHVSKEEIEHQIKTAEDYLKKQKSYLKKKFMIFLF